MGVPLGDAAVPAPLAGSGVTSSQVLPSAGSVDVVLGLALCSSGVLVLLPMKSAFADQGGAPKDQSGLISTICTLFAQCYFWAVYGHLIGQYDIFHFNGFGAGMCFAYLWLLCRGSRNKHCRQYMMLSVAVVIGLSFCIMGSVMPLANKAEACAYAAMLFSFLQSATPLVKVVIMFRQQTSSDFPFALAVSSCISNILWAEYALLVHDNMYLLSNVLNTMVDALSLFLAAVANLAFGDSRDTVFAFGDPDGQPLMPRTKRQSRMTDPFQSWLAPLGKRADVASGRGHKLAGGYNSFGDDSYRDVEFEVHTTLDRQCFESGLEEDQCRRYPGSIPMQVSGGRVSICVL
eukprot:gb/GFBE01055183.1/.p1 GENE.gb/GFBE01055183.1/~~gb/GFBE01055183.1/.p1  ORF type:complete len:347 (+),score=61.65 gb/GFBE01055183.1/:1-1041(+)